MTWRVLISAIALAAAAPTHGAQGGSQVDPLFAGSEVIRLTLRGPLSASARIGSTQPTSATLKMAGEVHPIRLSARGLTRRKSDICRFPPLRVEFTGAPPPTSLFAKQRRLKLVTHCRSAPAFQKYVLLEYAAYRMANVLTPASFRVRLAMIDYVEEDGRAVASRYGFFIEDIDDVARRNGLREVKLGDAVSTSFLKPLDAARAALFQHMIGNHDWSMRAGPVGAGCCHNTKLIGPPQPVAATVVPVAYDFDFSGLVDAPYAAAPQELGLGSVRERRYRGYCAHNASATMAAAAFRDARPQMLAELQRTPGLDDAAKRRAAAYLERFFADIATDGDLTAKVLRTCV